MEEWKKVIGKDGRIEKKVGGEREKCCSVTIQITRRPMKSKHKER